MEEINRKAKHFRQLLQQEIRAIQRNTRDISVFCNSTRHLNRANIELEALSVVIMRHCYLSNEEITELITISKGWYPLLYGCLEKVPNMIDMLRDNRYLEVLKQYQDYEVRVSNKKGKRRKSMTSEHFVSTLKEYIENEQAKMEGDAKLNSRKSYYEHIANFKKGGSVKHLAELQGLCVWLLRHRDLTSSQVENLLNANKEEFPFLNECVEVIPDMIDKLITHQGSYVYLMYQTLKSKEQNAGI